MAPRRPKNRGPFQLVPVMAKAIFDRLSKVFPSKANDHHPVLLTVPLSRQHGPGRHILLALIHRCHKRLDLIQRPNGGRTLQQLNSGCIDIAKRVCLEAIGENAKQ